MIFEKMLIYIIINNVRTKFRWEKKKLKDKIKLSPINQILFASKLLK